MNDAVEVVAEKLIRLAAPEEVDVEVAVEVEVQKSGSGKARWKRVEGGRPGIREIHLSKQSLGGLDGRSPNPKRHGNGRSGARAQLPLQLWSELGHRQPDQRREHLSERLLVTRRHAQDVLEDADLDGRALDVAVAEKRPGLPEKLTRACVAVRDERVQLRETFRQRGPVSRLPFEDEKLQARRQVCGRTGDDLGKARAAGGLFCR